MGMERAFFSVIQSTFSPSIRPSNGADSQSCGNSSLSARGSTTAPERAWLVISRPFSRTAIASSRPFCLARRAGGGGGVLPPPLPEGGHRDPRPFLLAQPREGAAPRQARRSGAHEDDIQL